LFFANYRFLGKRLKRFKGIEVLTVVAAENLKGETISMTPPKLIARLERSGRRERVIRSETRSRASLIKAN